MAFIIIQTMTWGRHAGLIQHTATAAAAVSYFTSAATVCRRRRVKEPQEEDDGFERFLDFSSATHGCFASAAFRHLKLAMPLSAASIFLLLLPHAVDFHYLCATFFAASLRFVWFTCHAYGAMRWIEIISLILGYFLTAEHAI